MLGTQDELEELLEVSEEMGAQRFYIAADDLNQESRMFVQSIREQIQREIRIIALPVSYTHLTLPTKRIV